MVGFQGERLRRVGGGRVGGLGLRLRAHRHSRLGRAPHSTACTRSTEPAEGVKTVEEREGVGQEERGKGGGRGRVERARWSGVPGGPRPWAEADRPPLLLPLRSSLSLVLQPISPSPA